MIFQEDELIAEVDKYFDSVMLADKLDEIAGEIGDESAYWVKEAAINLRCLLDICVSYRFHQMKRNYEQTYGSIGDKA